MWQNWRTFRLVLGTYMSLYPGFFSGLSSARSIIQKTLPSLLHFSPINMLRSVNFKEITITGDMPFSENKTTITVAVEGNIGSGKTTLLEYFKNSSEVEALGEPIDQWTNIKGQGYNALEHLYKDPERWSFSFNSYALLTRAQMHTKETSKPIKMLERSLYSTRHCFVENDYRNKTINGMEYTILTSWFDWLVKSQKANVDLIVYVRADPEVCFERIRKRARKEEALVPYSLIQDLHTLHEDWLIRKSSTPPAPVVLLDANKDYSEMKQLYETHRQEILCGYV